MTSNTNKQTSEQKERIVSDTDSFIDGIYDKLQLLDTKHNKSNYIYKRARYDIFDAFNDYSGYKGLGKTKISQGMLRYGAYLALDYAEKAGLGKYIKLLDLFARSSQGIKYCEQCCVNSNPSIAEMDGHSKLIIPRLEEDGLDDGYSNGSTNSLVYKVSRTIGSDLNYAAYLCLVLAIINSKSLCERFSGMLSMKDTYLTPNKISHAFKSKKEAYKRWFFGFGETLYNTYIRTYRNENKNNNINDYKALCLWKRIYKHEIGDKYPLPRPLSESPDKRLKLSKKESVTDAEVYRDKTTT